MKTALKIILWMLLGMGLLVLLAALAFGGFIYMQVNKSVLSYNCEKYVEDVQELATLMDQDMETDTTEVDPWDNYHHQMLAMRTTLSYGIFTSTREGKMDKVETVEDVKNGVELPFEDIEKAKQYSNELLSICKANPELNMTKFIDEAEDADGAGIKDKANASRKLQELVDSVEVTDHPRENRYFEVIAQYAKLKKEMEQQIVEQLKTISTTQPEGAQ